jgi:hypothetical protein
MADTTAFGASAAPEVGVGGIQSLKDLGDFTKTANPNDIKGLTAGPADIAGKFGDMGASFPNMGSASSMLSKISVPSVPSLDSAAPSLSSLIGGQSSVLNSMTGASLSSALSPNLGPNGLPSITDFAQSVAGGPAFTNILKGGVTVDTIAALEASTSKATSLFSTAGVDLTAPPPPGLGSSMNFATSLHKFGTNSEMSGLLSNMAVPNSQYGDSIKASLAEGRNKALMAQNGIPPLNFNNLPSYTGEDSSLNTNAAGKLLGGS